VAAPKMGSTSFSRMASFVSKLESKQAGQVRLLHLSDLHFEPAFAANLPPQFKWAKSRLKSRRPFDLVVVTGDLIDNIKELGREAKIEESMRSAEAYLREICHAVNVDPDEGLLIVPGNHDQRYAGLIGTDQLRNLRISKFLASLFTSRSQIESAERDKFEDVFGKYFKNVYFPKMRIALCCYDSNTPDWILNFASGFVEVDQFVAVQEVLETWSNIYADEMRECNRVALLHHHPMPLAETEKPGKEKEITEFEEFLLLRNSATFLRRSLEMGIGLVLHGHKHCGGFWRPATTVDGKVKALNIVAAGSLGKPGPNNRYSYNSVTVFEDGYLEVRRVDFDAMGNFERNLLPILKYEDVRLELHDEIALRQTRGKPEFDLRVDSVFREIVIQQNGDVLLREVQRGVRSNTGQPVWNTTAMRKSPSPYFHQVEYSSPGREVRVKIKGYAGTKYEYILEFDPPIGTEPTSLVLQARVGDAVMFSREDQKALGEDELDEAWKGREWIGFYADQVYEDVTMVVRFPKVLANQIRPELRVRVCRGLDLANVSERESVTYHVRYHWLDEQTAVLTIHKPISGYGYMLWWKLPDQHPVLKLLSVKHRLLGNRLQRALVKVPNYSDSMQEFLLGLIAEIRALPVFKDYAEDDVLVVLMGPGEDQGVLECKGSLSPADDPVRQWKCRLGEGLVGHAFRRREAIPSIRETKLNQQYVAACDPEHELLYAVPLLVPVRRGRPIGILVLLTRSADSWLNLLAEEAVRRAVGATIFDCYRRQFAEALRLAGSVPIPLDGAETA